MNEQSKTTVISREQVLSFCKQQEITNIPEFLHRVSRQNKEEFTEFISTQTHEKLTLQKTPKLLFHGSTMLHNQLEPIIEEKLVYATDNPNYAIFLAILNIQEEGSASVLVEEGKALLSISKGFVNGPSQFVCGYVHAISSQGFKESHNGEFVNKKTVPALFAIEVTAADLTEPVYIQENQ